MNKLPLLAIATLTPATAFAHTEGHVGGFAHPFGGLDHMLVMISVGIIATMCAGRAVWLLPAAFVAGTVGGGILAFAGLGLPAVEVAIAISAVMIGGLIMWARSLSIGVVAIAVAAFGMFHGHAHIVEMPQDTSVALYVFGFVTATIILHVIGVVAGTAILKTSASSGTSILRVAGGVVAALGLGILSGAV